MVPEREERLGQIEMLVAQGLSFVLDSRVLLQCCLQQGGALLQVFPRLFQALASQGELRVQTGECAACGSQRPRWEGEQCVSAAQPPQVAVRRSEAGPVLRDPRLVLDQL